MTLTIIKKVPPIVFWFFFANSAPTLANVDDITNHPQWNLFDHENCGEALSDRIIGGTEAFLGQYPWLARLGYSAPNENGEAVDFKCGGALISNLYVLTAGHCVETGDQTLRVLGVIWGDTLYKTRNVNQNGRAQDSTTEHSGAATKFLIGLKFDCALALVFVSNLLNRSVIRLGEHNTTSKIDCVEDNCAPEPQDIEVGEIIAHKEYIPSQLKADISLIRLAKPASLHTFVWPLCLPHGHILSKKLKGDMMEIAGWGTTDPRKEGTSTILLYIRVPVVTMTNCVRVFGQNLTGPGKGQLCAGGQQGYDSCRGDSGGPLMYVDAVDGPPRMYIVGVVSFGVQNCGSEKPAIYTDVRYHLKWILDNVKP